MPNKTKVYSAFPNWKGYTMAIVKPFCAVRPRPEEAKEVAALPYDVYSRKEAAAAVYGHPHSFLNIDRPETQFPPEMDMYSPQVYQKASELLKRFMDEGILIKEDKPCFYVYRQIMDGRTQTGLVGVSSIEDYEKGIIKKHENTREDKEQDRIRHVDICNAQTGPIFLAYRKNALISAIVAQAVTGPALYNFVAEDGISHQVWRIEDGKLIEALSKAFEDVPHTYIADGHHRAASAVKVGIKRQEESPYHTGREAYNYFLSVLFPDEELRILPYNRVVLNLGEKSPAEVMSEIEKVMHIISVGNIPVAPSEKGMFGIYLDGNWYRMKIRTALQKMDPVEGLDVSLLQDYVLAPILGIQDPRTDQRIQFVGGIRGLKELEKRADENRGIAFSLYATSIEELFRVADADRLMPPKSTWFEPKLRSGLFIHEI